MLRSNNAKIGAMTGLVAALLLVGLVASRTNSAEERPMAEKVRIVLVGASIGRAWNLSGFPGRTQNERYVFESVAAWQFDKSEALDEVLMRPKRKFRFTRSYLKGFFEPAPVKPDGVILKECSSYFPGDLDSYKQSMRDWVQRVRDAGVKPMVATVVPITRARAERDKGKMEGIRQFNDWVRQYAQEQNLPLLDLEAALREDARERHLRDELTSGDGSHLNEKAYRILDGVLTRTMCEWMGGPECASTGLAAPL